MCLFSATSADEAHLRCKANNQKNITIVLLGDSLVYQPCRKHHLIEKIHERLSNVTISVRIVNEGVNSDTISKIRDRTTEMLLRYQPDGVILFWDSDCSDYDESTMSEDEIKQLRTTYSEKLVLVSKEILNSGSLLSISGPEVLGEGKNEVKTSMLNDYRDMNRNISSTLRINYIDMRQAFLDDCPDSYPLYAHFGKENLQEFKFN